MRYTYEQIKALEACIGPLLKMPDHLKRYGLISEADEIANLVNRFCILIIKNQLQEDSEIK